MKQIIITGFFFLSCCTANSQYQTQKGKWMIYHSIISGGPASTEAKSYYNGLLDSRNEQKRTQIYTDIVRPWQSEIGFYHSKMDIPKPGDRIENHFLLNIQPHAGYFIKDNLMIGAAFRGSVMLNKAKEEGYESKNNGWDLGLGPIARYYFGKNKKGRATAGFESRFDIGREKKRETTENGNQERKEEDYKRSGTWIKPYGGYSFFLGKRWGADLSLSYSYQMAESKTEVREYTNKNIKAGYPKFYKNTWNDKAFLLSIGVSYTF